MSDEGAFVRRGGNCASGCRVSRWRNGATALAVGQPQADTQQPRNKRTNGAGAVRRKIESRENTLGTCFVRTILVDSRQFGELFGGYGG